MKLIQPQHGVIPKAAELREHYTFAPRQIEPVVKMTKIDKAMMRKIDSEHVTPTQ